MGWLILTIIAVFDPQGFMLGLLYAIPILAFGFGLFYANAHIWMGTAIIFFTNIVLCPMLGDNSDPIFNDIVSITPVIDVIASSVLLLVSIITFTTRGRFDDQSIASIVISTFKSSKK